MLPRDPLQAAMPPRHELAIVLGFDTAVTARDRDSEFTHALVAPGRAQRVPRHAHRVREHTWSDMTNLAQP